MANASKPVYDSATYRVSAISELQELGKYRYLLGQLIRRDILTRYKRSVLGVAWTMLNPLGTMLILTFVFSNFFKSSVPHYPVYILSGLLVWNFFSQGTNAAISGLVWGEYELVESKAPDGYDLDNTPHKFRIGPLEGGNIAGN